jgi:mono/diheme cytochrome c family protein
MKNTAGVTVVLLACILLWTVVVWGSDYVLGEIIYQASCQRCHGINGDGNGPDATSLTPKPANFNDPKFWQEYDEKKMNEVIRSGKGKMPAFDMPPDEIHVITEYMTWMFKKSK